MKKRLLFITFLFIGISTIILIRLNSTIFLDEQKLVYDNLNKVLHSNMNSIKQDALSFSLAAASFPILKSAILEKNQIEVTKILNELNDNMNNSFKNSKIKIQILTKERLYCTKKKEHFSSELYKNYYNTLFKELKNHKSLIDNTHNGIKITTPILDNGAVIAFFDIYLAYDVFVQNMRKQKIEMVVILKNINNETANNKEFIPIGENHYIANENYNKILIETLKNLSPKELEMLFLEEYLFKNELFYAFYDVKDAKGLSVGKFVAIVNEETFNFISQKEEFFLKSIVTINNTSEDFYNFVKHKEENMFLNVEKGYIKNLKDVVDEKDRWEFEEIAREKLFNLSKEELVDFILQQSKHKEIKGEIK
ncbi:MAG: hypothetical protein WC141_05820 [Arcobacteraceae bacterium]